MAAEDSKPDSTRLQPCRGAGVFLSKGSLQMTQTQKNDKAAAMKDGKKPGPKDAPVQVRPAGQDSLADKSKDWDAQDEAVDESFPASDASAKY